MNRKEIEEKLKDADFTQVEKYMRMFDRILLYNLVAHTMPEEFIDGAIQIWDKTCRFGIDKDATSRTHILQSTIVGRRAKYGKIEDGEKLRLDSLKQYEIARDLIVSNLKDLNIPDDWDDESTDTEYDSDED